MPDLNALLLGAGPWALGLIALLVFIESGVLFPFLPGGSLLVTAGILHPKLGRTTPIIAAVAFLAAAAGDQVGCWLGHRFGRRLFKEDANLLKTARLRETERFFDRYGGASLGTVPLLRDLEILLLVVAVSVAPMVGAALRKRAKARRAAPSEPEPVLG